MKTSNISFVIASTDTVFFCYMISTLLLYFVFFFQAEDGIRDSSVTGVQTCALPISTIERAFSARRLDSELRRVSPLRRTRDSTRRRHLNSARRRSLLLRHRAPAKIGRASCRERV